MAYTDHKASEILSSCPMPTMTTLPTLCLPCTVWVSLADGLLPMWIGSTWEVRGTHKASTPWMTAYPPGGVLHWSPPHPRATGWQVRGRRSRLTQSGKGRPPKCLELTSLAPDLSFSVADLLSEARTAVEPSLTSSRSP